MKHWIFFWALLTLCLESSGQNKVASFEGTEKLDEKKKYKSISLALTSAHYFGDLHPLQAQNFFKTSRLRPGITFSYEKNLLKQLDGGIALRWQRIFGDDFQYNDPNKSDEIGAYTRNLHFRNDLVGAQAFVKYKFVQGGQTYLQRPNISPYILIGLGLFYSNPKARVPEFKRDNSRFADGGKWTSLRPLGTEGQQSPALSGAPYSPVQIYLPMGFGVAFRVLNKMDLALSLTYDFVFTDHLDDVSGAYVDIGALDSEQAKALTDRSTERNAVTVNQPRKMERILEYTAFTSYTSSFDEQTYSVLEGYGEPGVPRGDAQSFDRLIYGAIKISYIIAPAK